VRVSPFWRSGLTFSLLLLTILPAIDFYSSRGLRREAFAAGGEELAALARVAQARLPEASDPHALDVWVSQMAASGARVWVLRNDGSVLADSATQIGASVISDASGQDKSPSEAPPEFRQAMLTGEGRAIRHDAASNRDIVYLAIRLHPPQSSLSPRPTAEAGDSEPVFLRLGLPLVEVDSAISVFRRRLWLGSVVLLLFVGGASLFVARNVSKRIWQLKEFSRRVAAGDFRPLETAPGGDELDELAHALNHTASQMDATIRVLTDERNRSAAILRSMIEGVAVISAQERVLFSNRAFSQILGVDTIAVEGRPLVEVVRQSDLLGIIKRALAGREEISSEIVVGTVRPRSFAVTASPVRADGPTGAVLVLHEITELRRLERVRQDFAANISHEFRTPLTAIQGFAETLLGGALEDASNRRRFVEIIRNHAARLARLTEDLLKLSRIEAGQLEIEFLPVSVDHLIEACLETARLKAAQRNLTLDVRVAPDLPLVRGDSNRLQEVLQNLLDNAVQYTLPGGRIELSASRVNDAVVLTVTDTGIGIPQAEQQRIFERFYRVDAARSREAGGTGLGLSIARHIVDAHGGQLWVESVVGEGSHFHFSIPVVS
jgi:two-component system phosphate regulon sensor histidine kinase PhoR